MPFFPDFSLSQLALIVGLAAFSGIAGGVAGYGTGRADAARAGADGRRRAGGADHRHFGDVHQFGAHRRVSPPARCRAARSSRLSPRCRPACSALGSTRCLSGRGAALVIGTTLDCDRAAAPCPQAPRPPARRKRLMRRPPPDGASWSAARPGRASFCCRF